jgi:DNA-binding CsgD family transcriptional regulator
LIGRHAEMDELRRALTAALDGRPQGLLLAGDAGAGKSRLLRALGEEAAATGALVVTGQAAAEDRSLPYGPFGEAIRRALRDAGVAPATALSTAGLAPGAVHQLSAFLPELLPGPPSAGAAEPGLPAVERRQLFEGVQRLLERLADERGLVLLLEDIHWADESSLDLLLFLLRGAAEADPGRSARLFLIGSYREEALADAPALERLLGQVTARRLARTVRLAPLTPAEYREMLAAVLGQELPPATAQALYERTEGNPFFTEELLGALAASGRLRHESGRWQPALEDGLELPLSVRATVLERLAGLDPTVAEALSYGAVIGREFDFELLQELTGLSEAALIGVLRQAVSRQLLVELADATGEERYRFRHALTREAIEGELLARERRMRHRAVAEALERRLAGAGARGELVDQLAYHYRLGGVPAKAREFALEAAGRAAQIFAFAEARQYLEAALATFDADDPERVAVVERLGVLSLVLLDLAAGVGWLEEAVALHRAAGRARRAAAVLCDLCDLYWYIDVAKLRRVVVDLPVAAQAAQRGEDGAGAEDPDAVKIYATVAAIHVVYDRFSDALAWADRALAAGEALTAAGQPVPRSPALYARGLARASRAAPGDLAAGIADLRRALDLALAEGQAKIATLIYNTVPYHLFLLGEDTEAQAIYEAGVVYERRTGAVTMANPAMNVIAGRWTTSLADVEQAVAMSRLYGAPTVTAVYEIGLGHLLADLGRYEEALTHLEAARPVVEPLEQFSTPVGPCWWGLARANAALGRNAEAADYYRRSRELWQQTENRALAIFILLEGTLFHAERRRLEDAARWAGDLGRLADATRNPVAEAAAAHAKGVLALRRGEAAAAQALLRDGATRWRALGRPLYGARALGRLAEAFLVLAPSDRTRRAEARAAAEEALRIARELGAAGTAAHLESLVQRARLTSPAMRRRAPRAGAVDGAALTAREREVLKLLAEGRKNREIAAALFIAESTAELHVSRILGKLGLSTRAQAAAWAVSHGVLRTGD